MKMPSSNSTWIEAERTTRTIRSRSVRRGPSGAASSHGGGQAGSTRGRRAGITIAEGPSFSPSSYRAPSTVHPGSSVLSRYSEVPRHSGSQLALIPAPTSSQAQVLAATGSQPGSNAGSYAGSHHGSQAASQSGSHHGSRAPSQAGSTSSHHGSQALAARDYTPSRAALTPIVEEVFDHSENARKGRCQARAWLVLWW
jgi:hypothetical protein